MSCGVLSCGRPSSTIILLPRATRSTVVGIMMRRRLSIGSGSSCAGPTCPRTCRRQWSHLRHQWEPVRVCHGTRSVFCNAASLQRSHPFRWSMPLSSPSRGRWVNCWPSMTPLVSQATSSLRAPAGKKHVYVIYMPFVLPAAVDGLFFLRQVLCSAAR